MAVCTPSTRAMKIVAFARSVMLIDQSLCWNVEWSWHLGVVLCVEVAYNNTQSYIFYQRKALWICLIWRESGRQSLKVQQILLRIEQQNLNPVIQI